jgi:hypothetical protein
MFFSFDRLSYGAVVMLRRADMLPNSYLESVRAESCLRRQIAGMLGLECMAIAYACSHWLSFALQ